MLYLVAGGWLAFFPFTGIVTLTILLAALFLAEGVIEVIMGFRVRPHEGWGWLLLSGSIAVAVGLADRRRAAELGDVGHRPARRHQSAVDGVSFIVLALAGKRGTAPAGAVTA